MACTKPFTAELVDVSGLWDLNEKNEEELLYLLVFVWSPRSKAQPRQDRYEKIDKNGKNCMHWDVAPDALPGPATLACAVNGWYARMQNM